MNRPPYLMKVHISKPDTSFKLWLPLFLIFPVIGVILIILLPLILIAAIILWIMGWGTTLFIVPYAIFRCMCALQGLEILVDEGKDKVLISVK